VARIVVPSGFGLKPNDEVIAEAFKALGCERWGGASINGWSRVGDLMRCPYRYWLKHIRQVVPATIQSDSTSAQDIGSLSHVLLASYYAGRLPDARYPGFRVNCPTPDAVAEALRVAGADPLSLQKARELWSGYIDHHGEDGWTPMAVEMPAGRPEFHTCRYDLIVHVEDGIHDGIWNVDHKNLSPKADIENYALDGEILGQMLCWKLEGLDAVFGPLEGTCINVLFKDKPPRGMQPYYRRWFRFDPALIRDFGKQRLWWEEWARDRIARSEFFPKSHRGCIEKFDNKCFYWEHCASLSEEQLVQPKPRPQP
jgi:hypothetical protein